MASRTGLLPRKEKETLDTPPETRAPGQVLLDPAHRLDEVHPVVVVLLDAGGHREDVGVEDDVLGREAHLLGEDAVGPAADLLAPLRLSAWPCSSKAMTMTAAP